MAVSDVKQQIPPIQSASDQELDIAYSGPAFFVNKFYATASGPNVRIAFAEQANPTKTPALRTAVVMTAADLLQLGKVIEHLAQRMQTVQIQSGPKKADG